MHHAPGLNPDLLQIILINSYTAFNLPSVQLNKFKLAIALDKAACVATCVAWTRLVTSRELYNSLKAFITNYLPNAFDGEYQVIPNDHP